MSSLQVLRQSRSRMLVEGADDLHAIVHLMKRHGVQYDRPRIGMPYVDACGSWSQVLEALPVGLKNYNQLAVVLDADTPEENRWVQVRERLRGANVSAPDVLPPGGFVGLGARPASVVGVWLMPSNSDAGMLEDFLGRMIPEDAIWAHAVEATEGAKLKGARFARDMKARVRAWLAWQESPGENFGVAIRKGYLKTDTPDAESFAAWFRRVFPEA